MAKPIWLLVPLSAALYLPMACSGGEANDTKTPLPPMGGTQNASGGSGGATNAGSGGASSGAGGGGDGSCKVADCPSGGFCKMGMCACGADKPEDNGAHDENLEQRAHRISFGQRLMATVTPSRIGSITCSTRSSFLT